MGKSRPWRESLRSTLRLTFLTHSRVFKPKDEEPYGRLNPKVRESAVFNSHPFISRTDNEVATSTISVDYSIRSTVSHS